MSIISVLILGIVEGLTEFLPVSSTFHLILIGKLINLNNTDFLKLFEVFIQGAAILAVLIIYWEKIFKNYQLIKKVIISFLPTALIGFILYKFIKNTLFESYFFMIMVFIFIGLVFIWLEFLIKKKKINLTKKIKDLDYFDAFLIGLSQSIAVIPGISRAGAVIVFMLFRGYKREESVLYSFLLAIPTIISACFFDLYKSRNLLIGELNNIYILFLGSAISLISAYLAIKWFLNFVSKNNLTIFAIYRILVGIIILIMFLTGNLSS